MEDDHGKNCNRSCTSCIRYYSNLREHGLMDWQLGVNLLRIMFNDKTTLFADSANTLAKDVSSIKKKGHEQSRILQQIKEIQDQLCLAGGQHYSAKQFSDLPGVYDDNRKRAFIIVHPLWQLPGDVGQTAPVIKAAMAEVINQYPNLKVDSDIRFVDTFNGARRPGWCLARL